MSQTGRDYSEKRDFIRMRVDADVSLIHALGGGFDASKS